MTKLFVLLFISLLGLGQTKAEDTLNIVKVKPNYPEIGVSGGFHSASLNKNSFALDRNLSFGIYLKYDLSTEVNALVGFSYWKSKSKDVFSNLQTIESKGARLELDFSLFKIKSFSLSIGPLVSIESVSVAQNLTFAFGAHVKLHQGLWDDRLFLVSSGSYQNGVEVLSVAGGGFNYSFINYSLGIEINPWR